MSNQCFVTASGMSLSHLVSNDEEARKFGRKILIAGLSEAGKTAVKRIFFLRQKPGDVEGLSATLDYERMTLSIKGTPFTYTVIKTMSPQLAFLTVCKWSESTIST